LALALSRGERVDRDPDALHRDAGRVRGHLHDEEGSHRPTLPSNPSPGSLRAKNLRTPVTLSRRFLAGEPAAAGPQLSFALGLYGLVR
jgi:hypothetical protein